MLPALYNTCLQRPVFSFSVSGVSCTACTVSAFKAYTALLRVLMGRAGWEFHIRDGGFCICSFGWPSIPGASRVFYSTLRRRWVLQVLCFALLLPAWEERNGMEAPDACMPAWARNTPAINESIKKPFPRLSSSGFGLPCTIARAVDASSSVRTLEGTWHH